MQQLPGTVSDGRELETGGFGFVAVDDRLEPDPIGRVRCTDLLDSALGSWPGRCGTKASSNEGEHESV